MRIIVAGLLMAVALFVSAGIAHPVDCIWTWRWDVKTLADSGASKVDFKPKKTSVHKLVGLKTELPVLLSVRQEVELRTYEVTCRIKAYSVALDGDLNLVLADPGHPKDLMLGEVPDPTCPLVKQTRYAKVYSRVWDEFRANCLGGGRIHTDGKERPVKEGLYTVTGVGFVDVPHFQLGVAPNNIELHPVLSVSKANLLIYWPPGDGEQP